MREREKRSPRVSLRKWDKFQISTSIRCEAFRSFSEVVRQSLFLLNRKKKNAMHIFAKDQLQTGRYSSLSGDLAINARKVREHYLE